MKLSRLVTRELGTDCLWQRMARNFDVCRANRSSENKLPKKKATEATPTMINGARSPRSHKFALPPAISNPTFTASRITTTFHSPEKSPAPIKDHASGLSVGKRNRNIVPGELTRLSQAGIVGKPTVSESGLDNVSKILPNSSSLTLLRTAPGF